MSLYQCQKCGCKENTAKGLYHCRNNPEWFCFDDSDDMNKALCSFCGPLTYSDGEDTKFGKWHGKFDRQFFELDTCYTDTEGNLRIKESEVYATAKNAIKIIKS